MKHLAAPFRSCLRLLAFSALICGLCTSVLHAVPVPELAAGGGSPSITHNEPAVAVDPLLSITGAAPFVNASVRIDNVKAGDVLSYDNAALPAGVAGSWNASTGVLLFTGSASTADWQALLRTVALATTSGDITTRTVTFYPGSARLFAATGHYYEYVSSAALSWTATRDAAAARTHFGLQGYLVTVTNAEENAFVAQLLSFSSSWLGATDAASESIWRWVTGPEGLEAAGAGRHFFTQTACHATSPNYNAVYGGIAGQGGNAIGGDYNQWAGSEPNDYSGNIGEDYLVLPNGGGWNDLPISSTVSGYVVEYGGMPGDPVMNLAAVSTSVTVIMPPPTITAVSPSSDRTDGGASITITGTNFLNSTEVLFGSTPASNFSVNNDTLIFATAPAGSEGPVDITVTNAGGISALVEADRFTYVIPPSACVVTTSADSGAGSLREAIGLIASGGIITLDPSLSGQTIVLTSTLVLPRSLTIDGGAAEPHVKISGNGHTLVFRVDPGVTATLAHLDIIDGDDMEVGGIYNRGTLTVQNCTVRNNRGFFRTGGIYTRGFLTIENSTITTNDGGGIWNDLNGTVTLLNCTVSDNESNGMGGCAFTNRGQATVNHCTIADNGGESGLSIDAGTLTLHNSIVANNGAGGTDNFRIMGGTFTSLGYNLSNDWNHQTRTAGDLTGNPLLDVLADNGSDTQTHALLAGSPALDVADPADATTTDQRGIPRPQGATSDMGAYETIHPTILTWHQPADLVYGNALSDTQLNASANAEGTFVYDPPTGTVLSAGAAQTLRATFVPVRPLPNESYSISTTITVIRAGQTITFAPLPDLAAPPASLTLGASASSRLRVSYSVSGPASVNANVLTFTGIGEIVVTARQPGNSNYMAAADVVRRFNVSKRFASVTVGNRTVTYDGTPHALTATTTPAGLNVAVTYSGSPTAPTSAGTYAVVATIDDADYAGESTGTLVIAKAPTSLTWPAPAAIVYGTPLSAAQLNATGNVPGVVTYTPAAGTALHAGIHPLAAAFTPTDSGNYMAATAPNTLTVTPAPLTVRVDDLTITRGSPIPTGMPRFSGWINGDGPSALLNPVVVATTASASSPAGTYALVPVGGASFDYAITRINGTLTIAAPAAPSITTQPASQSTTAGGTVTVSVTARGEGLTYQWYRQGLRIPDATSPTLTLPGAGPTAAGIYDCLVTGSGSSVLSRPVVIGIVPAPGTRTSGSVTTRSEWQGIQPLVGVAYDQFLLAGNAGTFTAAPGRVARMSFLDENESIVQVEMSGAGAVTIVLANASGPMAPALYNQPGILYMKGKATIVLAGADETTHFTIYSVGTATNPGVTRADVDYAGWADVAVAGIVSTNGGLGGIHQGNVAFTAATGFTGLYAPTVTSVGGLVVVHDIAASASAVPYLYFGPTAQVQVKIAGGSLAQPNSDVLTVSGLSQVQMGAGQDSCGRPAPAQAIQTRLVEDNGTDVTPSIVTGP